MQENKEENEKEGGEGVEQKERDEANIVADLKGAAASGFFHFDVDCCGTSTGLTSSFVSDFLIVGVIFSSCLDATVTVGAFDLVSVTDVETLWLVEAVEGLGAILLVDITGAWSFGFVTEDDVLYVVG